MKKICMVTATRAEYGLLRPVIKRISVSHKSQLKLVVTGMHLLERYGYTYREIEQDGFIINKKIEMGLANDTVLEISKSMGKELIAFSEYFSLEKPDIIIILGDRYEMLIVAIAAMLNEIPIAHIHGGESTEGLIDEAIRHSITKMSQLHFASTEKYRKRIIQLGENPLRVFNVGALGVENIKSMKLLSKNELEEAINFRFDGRTIMVTFHPVTLEKNTAKEQFSTLLKAIDSHSELKVIFTKANADADGSIINRLIDQYVELYKARCIQFSSLRQLRYLSALQYCCAVVGNSSSGIIEAPSFKIPTINIGDRQKGRICADSVINCNPGYKEIDAAFEEALSDNFAQLHTFSNPYEGINTSERIVCEIEKALEQGISIKKEF